MAKGKQKNMEWKAPRKIFLVFLFLIFVLFGRYCYLAISPTINGRNMKTFAANRNTIAKVLTANRGTIYDMSGNVLAHNVTSYTLIAYLDAGRSKGKNINHVKDIDMTAKALASVLEADENKIRDVLQKGKNNNKYQVEFGNIGKNITEMKKSEIEKLNLPGIDFEENYKRYYPNGNFASYILGYAKTNEEVDKNGKTVSSIDGELGIEAKFNDGLKGTDGYLMYQQDRFGYKIPDTKEKRIKALDGKNIYLTIDSTVQRFTETEIQNISNEYNPEWAFIAVMDAKTGDVLASSSSPSFNPNLRDITSYENPLVSNAFEPGSTMKIYTYMCAIDKGTYNGAETFKSGSIEVADAVIKDWNNTGWGTISYDKGFEYSSNVGVSSMINHFINKDEMKNCFKKYGFGKSSGIDLSREQTGNLGFKYPVEVANAAFGQGINTTPIQHLKALSMIANDGQELTPHVVSKIVDPNTGKTVYKRKVEKSAQLVKNSTVSKIKELMNNVVNNTDGATTGKAYHIDGFDVIGKTGTSQIYNAKTGGYLHGSNDYIYSFAGMYPKDSPEVIIYAAVKKPNVGSSRVLSDSINGLMKNIAKYKNMFDTQKNSSSVTSLKLDSYINKETSSIKSMLETNNIKTVVIGNGNKIINQYPNKGDKVLSYDKVFLFTNSFEGKMPNLIGYTRSEAIYIMQTLGYKYEIEGYGNVTEQSIKEGEDVGENIVKIVLSGN
ncbi:MAG: penicillin-binding transpeptidase domain-containing protein [Bacilli bacterium]|nr:penicillin-binding transpeptidase domain-containing protein [Bacilli bacterium]